MMRIFFLLITGIIMIQTSMSQDTFSICAIDTITGEVGSAGASCIGEPQLPGGCRILSYVKPGVGVIHTQAYYLAANQNYGIQLMSLGLPPQQIIDSLVAHDSQNNPSKRQYGIVDLFEGSARRAAYTGANCDDYKNHIIGPNYTIQGNILLGQQILDSMEARFLNAEGELACRLMAALQGAKVIGADTRCLDDGVSSLSSFLRVAQPNDLPTSLYLDLNVPSAFPGIDPIDSLQSLLDNWGGCLGSGMDLNNTADYIKVFPNPSNQSVCFSILDNTNNAERKVIIIDSYGRKVKEFNHIPGDGKVILEGHKPGLYFYMLYDANKIISTGKVVFTE
jgi:uncharacterized Ntn-hydrolase superfamily protein